MKIDTSTINGFDGMTAEQKLEALLQVELPDMSKVVSKEVFDKKAAEASELSKRLKEALDEDGRKKLAEEEEKAKAAQELADLKAKLEEAVQKNTVTEYKAKYLAQGYDEKLASETAEAFAKGDMVTVFANGDKFRESLVAKIKAELMQNTPKPDGGAGANDPYVEQAKKAGKAKADANKAAAETLSYFIKK